MDCIWSKEVLLCVRQGWGLLSRFPPFRYFPNFSVLPKHTLSIEDHVYIWQVSPQLSCGDICQIWMWCEESNRYFSRIENFVYGEFNERSFSNPHPWLRKALHRNPEEPCSRPQPIKDGALIRSSGMLEMITHGLCGYSGTMKSWCFITMTS